MASANGLINNNLAVNTLDGLQTVTTSGGTVDPALYVKYTGNTSNTDLNGYNLTTLGSLSGQILGIPDSAFDSENWMLYTISTNGNLSTLGGLIIQETTSGNAAYITGEVIGSKSFQFSTPGGINAGKVVCTDANSVMSTTISAGQLEYITALTSQAGGVGQANTWTATQLHTANVSTTGSAKFIQPYNATTLDISTLVNRATMDAALALVPNLLPLSNTWTGSYNQFNGTVSTMGTNRFIQPYNATTLDISTLVNRATLDSAISGLGAGILTLNNTWSGTNTFNSTLTTGVGYTTSLNGVLSTNLNDLGFTSASFTTSGITGTYSAPLGTITNAGGSTYQIAQTASGRSIMAISGFTPVVGKTYVFSFNIKCTVGTATIVVEQNNIIRSPQYYPLSTGFNRVTGSFYYDGTPNTIIFNIYTGTLSWNAQWDSFTLSTYSASITAPLTISASTIMTPLTSSRALVCDANKVISTSATTTTELGYLSGVTAPIQTQLGNYVLKAGDTMTGALTLANANIIKNGTTAGYYGTFNGGSATNSPIIEFYANSLRRLYVGNVNATDAFIVAENGAQLNLETGGVRRMSITNTGTYIQGGQNTFIQSPTSVNAGGGIDTTQSLTIQTNYHRFCQTFTLALAPTTWFPVVIKTDQAWNQNYPAKFTIGRSSVHTNGSWWGGMMFNMELHGTNWGNECDYYKITSTGNLYTGPATYKFFVGNVIIDNTSGYAVIYLRGGTTYFFTGEGCSLLFYPATSPFAGYTIPAGNNTTYYAITSPVAPWTRGYVQYDSLTNLYSFGDFGNGNPNVAGGGTTGFIGNASGQLTFYNQYQTNGFLTHAVASLNANILYSNTAVTQGNPGSWYGGWTLLTNTATPSVNQGALGLGSNYVDNSFITSLRPGVVWMNLGIWNAQTTFTYYGNPSGYTVPSGGANVSDVREKHCISDVNTKNSLRKIMMVKTKYYKRKYYDTGVDSEGKERTPVPERIKNEVCIGVMAQDLLDTPLAPAVTVAPIKSEGACGDDDGTRYGVNYGDISIHMIGAIQEVVKQNEQQQKEIDDLKEMVKALMAKIK